MNKGFVLAVFFLVALVAVTFAFSNIGLSPPESCANCEDPSVEKQVCIGEQHCRGINSKRPCAPPVGGVCGDGCELYSISTQADACTFAKSGLVNSGLASCAAGCRDNGNEPSDDLDNDPNCCTIKITKICEPLSKCAVASD